MNVFLFCCPYFLFSFCRGLVLPDMLCQLQYLLLRHEARSSLRISGSYFALSCIASDQGWGYYHGLTFLQSRCKICPTPVPGKCGPQPVLFPGQYHKYISLRFADSRMGCSRPLARTLRFSFVCQSCFLFSWKYRGHIHHSTPF